MTEMIQSPEETRAVTSELTMSVWTLAAIGALFEMGIVEHLSEPRTIDELAELRPNLDRSRILRTLGVATVSGFVITEGARHRLAPGAMPFAELPMRSALAGDIRATLMQAVAFLDTSRDGQPSRGWQHTNPAILQSQGDASSALAVMMKRVIVPSLEGMTERLQERGAQFLDVGTGVASLAIAMCRLFPAIDVVGLDVSDAALALATKNVAAAGFESRIELRRLAAEDLYDQRAYDLAWLPSFFIPSAVDVCEKIHAALRPGGFILFAFTGNGPAPRGTAVGSLIAELWGGIAPTASEVRALLERAGFSAVRSIPGPDWAPSLMVGRRD
jgi:SAM-dependent methyltransferase